MPTCFFFLSFFFPFSDVLSKTSKYTNFKFYQTATFLLNIEINRRTATSVNLKNSHCRLSNSRLISAGRTQDDVSILLKYEPPHEKTNNVAVCPAKTLGDAQADQRLRCPHEERLDPQLPIERTSKALISLPRLIWVFVVRIATLLVLSWGS